MSDTIAAIATAPGNSGIGIVRISGDDAISIADKIYRSPSGKLSLKDTESHTIHYGHIFDEKEAVDEVLVSIFRSPRSFTGENTVEINCHGGYFVTKKVLSTVLKAGARAAQPGEFTKRAFMNGRIDLSEAEAVIDIINARNDFSLKNSLTHLSGRVHEEISVLRNALLDECAFIESALDDPEHYDVDEHRDILKEKCSEIYKKTGEIIEDSANCMLLKNGIRTLIIGKPNAGKSSLLNAMTGHERAIVTDIAGTTRDVIEETVNLNGIILNLTDTAGVRSSDDMIERMGVDKALSLIDSSDLILYVFDPTDVIDDDDRKLSDAIKGKKVIILLNKTDISGDNLSDESDEFLKSIGGDIISISAKTGFGLDDLKNKINDMFLFGQISCDEEIYLTNERQLECLRRAYSSLQNVVSAIEDGISEDFITIDLMDAYSALGEITGEQVSDDLADRIFEKFCMGK